MGLNVFDKKYQNYDRHDVEGKGDLIFVTKHKMFLLRLTPLSCTKRALSSLLYPNKDLDLASKKTFSFFLFSPLF